MLHLMLAWYYVKNFNGEMMTLDELKATHWSQLKKMVEEAGGTYENKEKSIQFMIDSGAVTENIDSAEEIAIEDPVIVEDLPTLKLPDADPVSKSKSKSTAPMDRSRPFGEIFGEIEGFPTARYSQGEHFFNSKGEKL